MKQGSGTLTLNGVQTCGPLTANAGLTNVNSALVPEPGGLGLLAVGALGLASRRRRPPGRH